MSSCMFLSLLLSFPRLSIPPFSFLLPSLTHLLNQLTSQSTHTFFSCILLQVCRYQRQGKDEQDGKETLYYQRKEVCRSIHGKLSPEQD